jgi:hypothetical protein
VTKHPAESILALYAGGDLGIVGRWRTARHVDRCERCQAGVARFEAVREEVATLDDLPGIAWNRIAGEMKANIRLGLAAGEIVRNSRSEERRTLVRPRALVAAGCVAALLMAGFWLQYPAPRLAARDRGVRLEMTEAGIALRDGNRVMTLVNGRQSGVVYTAGAQGVMRARFVDSETGQVTINNVYVE